MESLKLFLLIQALSTHAVSREFVREGFAFIQSKAIYIANSREASGVNKRKLQVSPEAHFVPALAASSLPVVEAQT